ncbi:hypothetical protein BLNAU_24347 [Blattamonas nauphoetae]|uniref:Carrier domain-containing protein n=1 Tax=Blattamonas nauphoetae TaxID=2049346 RepID=A0ABQ9WMR8_9EUKA|nr:hypothetical protein BLNAU_24347 [Blattamonas nauphoetae]
MTHSSHKLRQALTISIIQEQPELHLVCQIEEAATLLEVVTSLLSLSNVEMLIDADFSIDTLLESSRIKIQSSILDFGREFT